MSRKVIQGYSIEEIDDLGAEIFQFLAEQQLPTFLVILGLCRAITLLGNEEELDMACTLIDELAEAEAEEEEDAEYEEEDALDDDEALVTEEDEDEEWDGHD